MTRRHDKDEFDEKPASRRSHRSYSSVQNGSKTAAGVLLGLLTLVCSCPILYCGGCMVGFNRGSDQAAKGVPNPQQPPPVAPPQLDPIQPVAPVDKIVLNDKSGYVAFANTQRDLINFSAIESDGKDSELIDFFRTETVTRVKSGTEIKVLESGAEISKVTVTDGYFSGRTGHVWTRMIRNPDAERRAELARSAEQERKAEAGRKAEIERQAEADRNATKYPRLAEVWTDAKFFIKDRLKSPSTADFGSQLSSDTVKDLGSGEYMVTGWVDSQNGFGATVRTDFRLHVKHKPGGYDHVKPPVITTR